VPSKHPEAVPGRPKNAPDSPPEARIVALGAQMASSICPVQPMRIALYEPDIPQNTGTILRLCACFAIEAHIIEPAGFPTTDRAFRRAGMDYLDAVAIVRHRAWRDFEAWRNGKGHRLLLFTTAAPLSYLDYRYVADDILLFGRESAGVPPAVWQAADARLKIPMRTGLRSLNVAVAAAMAAGEALRQTGEMGASP
jgi:tRNA (cytidine/uridine-2'-O-)-methyltransferase